MSADAHPMAICPRCGHENVPSAVYCFRCGRDLREAASIQGSPGTGKLVAGALRFIQMRGYMAGLDTLEQFTESKKKMASDDVIGYPLICLNCGTPNRPDALHCESCHTALINSNEDFSLISQLSARTDVGMVRSNNEDNLGMWAIDGYVLAMVADGMGGAMAGEVASAIAVESVQAHFLGPERRPENLHTLSETALKAAIQQAIAEGNDAVIERAAQHIQWQGMGTTATLALIFANRLLIAHVGDSRAYHIEARSKQITQVTEDHSFVQAMVSAGHITSDQALTHPMGHVLYRALGQSSDLEIDIYARYVANHDWIVLCSDGLTLHITPAEIAEIALRDNNSHAVTEALVSLAKQRGGMDNVSVIAIRMFDASGDETVQLSNQP